MPVVEHVVEPAGTRVLAQVVEAASAKPRTEARPEWQGAACSLAEENTPQGLRILLGDQSA